MCVIYKFAMDAHFEAIANWPFAATLKEKYVGTDVSNEPRRLADLISAWGGIQQLSRLSCRVCGGRGHPMKGCPTARRIRVISRASAPARNRISLAFNHVTVAQAAHVDPDAVLRLTVGVGALAESRKRLRRNRIISDSTID